MTSIEVVTAYAIALSKGDIPTAFSHFSQVAKFASPDLLIVHRFGY